MTIIGLPQWPKYTSRSCDCCGHEQQTSASHTLVCEKCHATIRGTCDVCERKGLVYRGDGRVWTHGGGRGAQDQCSGGWWNRKPDWPDALPTGVA